MKWSDEDVRLLRINYPSKTWPELLKLFKDRSRVSITEKGRKLGLKRTRFSTKGGFYSVYAICPRHGRILVTEIRWNSEAPKCPRPYCNRNLRMNPRHKSKEEKNV